MADEPVQLIESMLGTRIKDPRSEKMALIRLSLNSASKAAVAGVRCDGGSVKRSPSVFDKRDWRARMDPRRRNDTLRARGAAIKLADAAARRQCRALGVFDKLPLRGGSSHDRPHVDFAAALGIQRFLRSHCLRSVIEGRVTSA